MSGKPSEAWLEFSVFVKDDRPGIDEISICGLCGNSGLISTLGTARTPRGIGAKSVGVEAYCICPNGRSMKKNITKSKWGGTSVVTTEADGGIKDKS